MSNEKNAEKLTESEKQFLNKFLNSVSRKKTSPTFSDFYALLISIAGLLLFAAAIFITLNYFYDKVVYWVFLPGIIGGSGIILLGIFLSKYLKISEEKRKLISIIREIYS